MITKIVECDICGRIVKKFWTTRIEDPITMSIWRGDTTERIRIKSKSETYQMCDECMTLLPKMVGKAGEKYRQELSEVKNRVREIVCAEKENAV